MIMIMTSPGRQFGTSRDGQIGSLGDVLGTYWGPMFAGWEDVFFFGI